MEVSIYTAFGDQVANTVSMVRTGYADSVRESDLPWYLLGLRFYLPWLRRFISTDAASPFNDGGFNRYAYCSCDPINRIDPSGNVSFGWLGKLLGNLTGAVGSVARTVAQATPTSALMAVSRVAEAISVVTSIGAITAAAMDEVPAAGMLGLIAAGAGVAGAGLGVAGQSVSKSSRANRSSGTRSNSTGLAVGDGQRGVMRGNPKDPSTGVMKSTLDEPGNRVVVNYRGVGLKNMSALRGRLGPPDGDIPFSLAPGTATWINDHGGEVVGYDSGVRIGHIMNLIRDVDSGNDGARRIRVFVGVHGNGTGLGDNWYQGQYRQDLYANDVTGSVINKLAQMPLSSRVGVFDMSKMTDDKFMRFLTNDDAINILGWCFSVADEKANQARMSLGEREPFHYRTYKHSALV
ncbi:hypothetical protein KCV01_g12295, partial [Aureobasidium melanogenum]